MSREKKEKMPKYYSAEVVRETVKRIFKECNTFSFMSLDHFEILFKNGKNKLGKKHVNIKILKEPITFTTSKKLVMTVTNEFWDENIDSDRIKAIIEALMGIARDKDDNYIKRDYDVMTYEELLENPEYDFSDFSKILPAESKPENLVLTSEA